MESYNRLSLRFAAVCFCLTAVPVIALLLGPNNFTVSQTYASVTGQDRSNNTHGNITISHDPESTVAAMETAFGKPFYDYIYSNYHLKEKIGTMEILERN